MPFPMLKCFMKTCPQIRGSFHTAPTLCAKPGRAMRKVMGTSSSKKRAYVDNQIMPSPQMFSKGSLEGRYSRNNHRSTVLNKMFMRYITDIMAYGECSSELLGHGIEVNRVQIAPNFRGLNVFWVAKGTKDDALVEKILQKNAGYLRHELSTLRVMGEVPKIQFVRDRQLAEIVEVDSRLAVADFGEDHVPVEISTKLKTQLELFTPLDENIKEKIMKLDDELSDEVVEEFEEVLPQMPQNVLGLNHADILKRVQRLMKKSEAVHRLSSCDDSQVEHTINEEPVTYSSARERRESFKEFLQKRELLRSKLKRVDKNYFPDLEYIKEELEGRQNEYYKNLDTFNYAEEEDYVEEDDHKT